MTHALVCVVEGCDREDVQGRDMCRMHYFRWYRTGSTDVRCPQRAARGICTIDGCEKRDVGPHGHCAMHNTRVARHGDPHTVLEPRRATGPEHEWWTGDDATYTAVHQRLAKARGKAGAHACVDCGARARQWSYDRSDPDERSGREGPYSTDLARYVPRCVPCHKVFDLAAIR